MRIAVPQPNLRALLINFSASGHCPLLRHCDRQPRRASPAAPATAVPATVHFHYCGIPLSLRDAAGVAGGTRACAHDGGRAQACVCARHERDALQAPHRCRLRSRKLLARAAPVRARNCCGRHILGTRGVSALCGARAATNVRLHASPFPQWKWPGACLPASRASKARTTRS
jgi:hypothetical protein